jgi:hypothetical protein
MTIPGGLLEGVIEPTSYGIGAGIGFFAVRWLCVFMAGRWDKKEAQLDAATKLLIEQLQTQVGGLIGRLVQIEKDLADCKRMHSESEADRMRLNALLQGMGDARNHAQLIIADEKRKDKA